MKKILVLSGGGSFGCFEMAVVCALIKAGKGSWDLLTGVSAGSLNASYLSTISKDDELANIKVFKKLWCDIKNVDVFQKEYFFNGMSFYNSDRYKKTIKSIYDNKTPIRPIMISSTSLSSSASKIFKNVDIETHGFTDIVMASSLIPILFKPYAFLDDVFVDGGFSSNIILDDAINYCNDHFPGEQVHIDVIVCSRKIEYEHVTPETLNLLGLVEKLINIVEQQVEYFEIIKNVKTPTNVTVKVYEPKNKPSVSFLDFDRAEELWDYGSDLENINVYTLN